MNGAMGMWMVGGCIVIVDKWVNKGTVDVKVGVGGVISLIGLWGIAQWNEQVANYVGALILIVIALTYGYDLSQKLLGGAYK